MSTSAFALAGVNSIRPGEGTDAPACAKDASSAAIAPHWRPIDRAPARYRDRPFTGRLSASGVTVAVHVLVAAVVVYDWHPRQEAAPPQDAIVATLLPPAPDRPAQRQDRGVAVGKAPPKPASAELPTPIVNIQLPPLASAEPLTEPPAPANSGKEEELAQTTQAYRRAVLADLEAERFYPRSALLDGYHGNGRILLRVDRQGNVLDVVIQASTGRKALDRAALAMVRRAAPLPVIPAELPDELAITMPIEFLIISSETRVAAR